MIFSKIPLAPIRWISVFMAVSILCVTTVLTVNFLVDPFGSRDWIVEKKYKPIVKERSEKYNTIFNQNNLKHFDCLILGSSRAMKIDPSSNPEIGECYNFAVSMASNHEKLFILTEWLKYKKPSALYMGVDFLNFHRDVEHPDQAIESRFTHGNEGNYLSHYAFKMAVKSLKNSITNKPETFFEPNGSINYSRDDQKIAAGTFDFSQKKYQKFANSIYKERFVDLPYVYTSKSLEDLRKIKHLCDKYHIKLIVFIPPEQIEATKKIITNPELYQHYKHYKRDIVTLFGTVYDFSGGWPENKNQKNFYDVWHYRSLLGDKMVDKFYGKNTFGTIITQDNISNHLIHFHENIE